MRLTSLIFGHAFERRSPGAEFYASGDGAGREHAMLHVTHHDDGLLAIELARPERLNALNDELMDGIVRALETTDVDEVRAVSFEGAGDRAFSAGADITGFADDEPHEQEVTPLFQAVAEYHRPTLAKIDGYCLGGGHELALACDLRIATERSEFGFPEIRLGLLPGGGGTKRAMRMLTDARAKELVFRGNRIDAETAEAWGLINRAVPEEEFEETVDAFLSDLLEGPPIALRKAKRVMDTGRDQDLSAGLEMEAQAFGLLLSTDDATEGTTAFLEDREAEFEGR